MYTFCVRPSRARCYSIPQISPPVHFHVLPVEEKHGSWYQGNVEIFGVHRDTFDIDNVEGRHLRNGVLIFGQLKDQQLVIQNIPLHKWTDRRKAYNGY